ncbi:MAG: hypothetical protein QXD13_00675 [Candidatus Pacearchaeota archaeon]
MAAIYHTRTISRHEIDDKLKKSGDFVKLDFLSSCLKKQMDFDTKKFVLLKLAELYSERKMFAEAGKMMRAGAEINGTYEGKMNDFIKSGELFAKAGNFDEADVSFTKALGSATEMQRAKIKTAKKTAYFAKAKELMQRDRRSHAMEAYEKLLLMDLNPIEKHEVQNALLQIYEKLGKVKEFYALKAGM